MKSHVFELSDYLIGYPTFKGQVIGGAELWNLIEGLDSNNLLFYTHLLTGMGNLMFWVSFL